MGGIKSGSQFLPRDRRKRRTNNEPDMECGDKFRQVAALQKSCDPCCMLGIRGLGEPEGSRNHKGPQARWLCRSLLTYHPAYSLALATRQRALAACSKM